MNALASMTLRQVGVAEDPTNVVSIAAGVCADGDNGGTPTGDEVQCLGSASPQLSYESNGFARRDLRD